MSRSAAALVRKSKDVCVRAGAAINRLEQEGKSSDAAAIRRLVAHHLEAIKKLEAAEAENELLEGGALIAHLRGVMDERKRCAELADKHEIEDGSGEQLFDQGYEAAARGIASDIRSGARP